MRRHAVIVGGGITGVATFIALVEHQAASRIDIIDPLPIGRGMAFDTTEMGLLCNTSVDTMSLIPGVPDDFLQFLRKGGQSANRNDFVPRRDFARYAMDRYTKYRLAATRMGIEHRHIAARATAIRPTANGLYRVLATGGEAVLGTGVCVCLGYSAPIVPELAIQHVGEDLLFSAPYPEGALLVAIPEHARVLVLGTGLSALDATILLCRERGCRVVMTSRSGVLPAVRTGTPRPVVPLFNPASFRSLDFQSPLLAGRIAALIDKATRSISSLPLRQQVARPAEVIDRLRTEVCLAAEGKTHWQDLLVELVDITNDVLVQRTWASRQAAVRICKDLLTRYLGAMPLDNARALLRHVDDGTVTVRAGVPVSMERAGGRWQTVWPNGESEKFDAVVCATGFHKPRFHASTRLLEINPPTSTALRQPEVMPDLRVALPGRHRPENIWFLGISSYLRVPLVNAVYQAARQADAVARAIAEQAARNRTVSIIGQECAP